jgi:hypothetical protein
MFTDDLKDGFVRAVYDVYAVPLFEELINRFQTIYSLRCLHITPFLFPDSYFLVEPLSFGNRKNLACCARAVAGMHELNRTSIVPNCELMPPHALNEQSLPDPQFVPVIVAARTKHLASISLKSATARMSKKEPCHGKARQPS